MDDQGNWLEKVQALMPSEIILLPLEHLLEILVSREMRVGVRRSRLLSPVSFKLGQVLFQAETFNQFCLSVRSQSGPASRKRQQILVCLFSGMAEH